MKTRLILPLIIFSISGAITAHAQEPNRAPFINKQINELNKKADSDLASGALSQTDADEIKRQVKEVKDAEEREPTLTPKTRRDLNEKLGKIYSDLQRKEKSAKAAASAAAGSPDPFAKASPSPK